MKNIYNIALGLLFILVSILFFLQLKGKKSSTSATAPRNLTNTSNAASLPMAYFDIDSINENYKYCVKVKQELERMKDEMDNKLQSMQSNLESTQLGMQKKAQAGAMNQQEQEAAMGQLGRMQQEIVAKKEEFINQFETSRKKFEVDLKKDIQDYIKKYNTPQKYSFIIADEPDIFYYRDSLYDITTDVLNGLNEKYKKTNKN
jgi:outer membrane protein